MHLYLDTVGVTGSNPVSRSLSNSIDRRDVTMKRIGQALYGRVIALPLDIRLEHHQNAHKNRKRDTVKKHKPKNITFVTVPARRR